MSDTSQPIESTIKATATEIAAAEEAQQARAEQEATPSPDPGVVADTVVDTLLHTGEVVREKVVHDYDENGELIGWHKEPESDGGQ